MNYDSPAKPLPLEWETTGRAPAREFMEWLTSPAPKGGSRANSIWKGRNGYRADLGHSCRSDMEANMERFLRYLEYLPWTEKHPSLPPLESGKKFYRYEGRRWDFPQKTSTGFYLADLEVWPGYINPKLPYEVLEVKGYLDGKSKTKIGRMEKYFPDVRLELITPAKFAELTAGASSIVPGWDEGPSPKPKP